MGLVTASMSKALMGSKAVAVGPRCVAIVQGLARLKVAFIIYSKQRCSDREGLFRPIGSLICFISSNNAIVQGGSGVLGMRALPSRI